MHRIQERKKIFFFRRGSGRTVLPSTALYSAVLMNGLAVANSTHHSYRRSAATLLPAHKSGGESKQYITGAGWWTNLT